MTVIDAEAAEATLALAAEFMDAIQAGDPERLRAVYDPDIRVWHTFDRVEQVLQKNLRLLGWMHRHVRGLAYDEIRVAVTPDGFVQQHVTRGEEPKFDAPCMLRAWCSDGRITRIEEYLDSADSQPLTDYIAGLRRNER